MACCVIGAFLVATVIGRFRKLNRSYDSVATELADLRAQAQQPPTASWSAR